MRKTHLRSIYALLVKPKKPFELVLVETTDYFAHNQNHIGTHQSTCQEASLSLISKPFEYLDMPMKNFLLMMSPLTAMLRIYFPSRERERESRLLLDLLVYCACVAEVVTSEEVLVLFGRKLRLGQGLRS